MTLEELEALTASNKITLRDNILYQLYLETSVGGGGVNTDILNAIQTYDQFVKYYLSGITSVGGIEVPIQPESIGDYILLLGGTFYNPNAVPVFLKFFRAGEVSQIEYQVMIPALGQVILDANTVYASFNDSLSCIASTSYNSQSAPATALLVSNIKTKFEAAA